jgi:carbamoylphosphate synthase small subunit
MTMGMNSIEPCYRGLVEIDDNNYVQHDDGDYTPVEDYGCFYYMPENEPFPIDRDWMFNKFLSLMDD